MRSLSPRRFSNILILPLLSLGTTQAAPRLANSPTEAFPSRLSETGLFADAAKMEPGPAMLSYELNVPFWSDGADKTRWIVMPEDKSRRIRFDATGEWSFPHGTVFVKHFDLAVDETNPRVMRRLETRVLVADGERGVFGVTYKWRADNSDADLLATNLLEDVLVRTASGTRTQKWYYPSREDCLTCHTRLAGGVLGVTARQMNREMKDARGHTGNQLIRWKRLGLFEGDPDDQSLLKSPALARTDADGGSLEQRARSWLDANCAYCHRPGGTVATFDSRFNTPPEQQNLVNGPVLIDRGVDNARVIAPNDIWRSVALQRINTVDEFKMPPGGRQVVDQPGVELIRQWIQSLPGPPVLAPPVISGRAGTPSGTVVSVAHGDSTATLRYTLDGSAPGKNSDVYSGPVTITNSTTVRARAYREGFTRSITVNETFILKP
jgi:uncharacterized repeat protein (TIGR03806 family)